MSIVGLNVFMSFGDFFPHYKPPLKVFNKVLVYGVAYELIYEPHKAKPSRVPHVECETQEGGCWVNQ